MFLHENNSSNPQNGDNISESPHMTFALNLREAIPLCVQNKYRKIRRTQQKVIYCYTEKLVSTVP
jgi:hypothetical protein